MTPRASDLDHRDRSSAGRALVAVLVGLVLLGLGVGLAPGALGAQEDPGQGDGAAAPSEDATLTWSVRPTPTDEEPERPNFSYEIDAGETIRDSLRVRNFGPEELPLVVYASDAVVTPNGALDLLPAGEAPKDVGAWVRLGSGLVTVPPGEFVDIPFVVTVPADAESGDHSGGIVTSLVSESTDEEGEPVRLDRRLGSRMHVRVSGELWPELAVTDLAVSYEGRANPVGSGSMRVSYTVENVGNVRLAAEQRLRIRGLAGLGGKEVELEATPELLVGSSLSFDVEVGGVWPTFRTEVVVELAPYPTREGDEFDPEVLAASSSARTWTIPWALIVTLLVVVLVGLVVRWRRRQRTRREDARVEAAVTAALQGTAGDVGADGPARPADDQDAGARR